MNFHIIYYPLYMLIMQVSHDSGHMPNSGLEDATPVVCVTPVICTTSVLCPTLVVCSTPTICLTPVGRRNSRCMPDSGQKIGLWSYVRLWLEDMTLVVYPNSGRTSQLRLMSRLQPHFLTLVDIMTLVNITTPITHHDFDWTACHMSYQLICERLRMVELDDRNILQLKHLVRSRSGRAHDLFSIQNLNISWFRMFKCQAMCRMTNEHLVRLDLTKTRVSRRTRYPL
jgi:hypothetical protein